MSEDECSSTSWSVNVALPQTLSQHAAACAHTWLALRSTWVVQVEPLCFIECQHKYVRHLQHCSWFCADESAAVPVMTLQVADTPEPCLREEQ